MSDTVIVTRIPNCDLCRSEGRDNIPAEVDGKTQMGLWANMCESHFLRVGVGLGTGRGQWLVARTAP